MNKDKIKVAIAEDHLIVRQGVRGLIEKMPDVEVVGEAEDGLEAIEIIERSAPDVLILDIEMPAMNGIEVLKTLKRQGLKVVVMVLSIIDDPYFIREVLNLGACIYVTKGDINELVYAIRQVLTGQCSQRKQMPAEARARIY
jgi:DNA-binding NarL/FixJ family response regulator